jgi:mannuronan 5-epimerase
MDEDERRREKTERLVRIEEKALELEKKMARYCYKQVVGTAVFLAVSAGMGNATDVTFNEVSVAPKTTNYSIPSGAFFVSSTGDDRNPGSQSAPWRTVKKAVDTVPAGSTIVLRGGVYRGTNVYVNKTLTFQAYPGEQIWIKGSEVVSGWVQDGSAWRSDGWVPVSSMAPGGNTNSIDPAYPAADYPDQVFLDGVPLRQVLQMSDLGPGKFYVDHSVQKLWISDNPTGKIVEASSLDMAMFVAASNTKILGLAFMHYAPTINTPAAVILNAPNIMVENCVFAFNAYAGLQVNGNVNNASLGYVIRTNDFVYNGARGLGGYAPNGSIIERNYIGYNNTEHFKIYWDAAGAKFAHAWYLVVRDNIFEGNLSKGFWCDWACYELKFVRNLARGNSGAGFYYELSQNAVIASNLVYNNQIGINATQSGDLAVWNNTISNNGSNIAVDSYGAVDPVTGATGDATAPGIVRNNVVKNNILSGLGMQFGGQYGMFYTFDQSGTQTGEQMISELDYDAYYRPNPSFPACLILWGFDPCYPNITAFRTATSKELRGFGIDGGANPFFIDEGASDYRLAQSSPAKGAGTPLPASIAADIGVQANVAVDMGALEWPGKLVSQPPKSPKRTHKKTLASRN